MKRLFFVVLILALALLVAGCGSKDDTAAPALDGGASPSPSPVTLSLDEDDAWDGTLTGTTTPAGDNPDALDAFDGLDFGDEPESTAEPTPTPAPTPLMATEVEIKNYELVDYTDEELGISLKVPSHWTVETSATTLSFTEPVAADKTPMRLALTVKTYTEDKLTTAQQKKEFTSYVSVIKDSYDKYKSGKLSNKMLFMNRSSMSATYAAKSGNTNIKGYITMGAVPRTKQIVALHYSAPNKKYKNSKSIFKQMLYSVTPIGVSVTE